MKKTLYILLALVMVNLNAEVLSSTPIKAAPHEFGSGLNAYNEKVARALLRKPSPHLDSYYPYAGLGLLGIETDYGFCDFGIDLMINPQSEPVAFPIPDLRWGFRF